MKYALDVAQAPLVATKDLNFSYGRVKVLHDVTMSAGSGEIIGLLGPNGSGKSTLLRCIAGLLTPTNGSVHLQGHDIRAMRRKHVAAAVSFLPQVHEQIHNLRVVELVARGRHPHTTTGWHLSSKDQNAVSEAIGYMELSTLQDRSLDALSGGERQRAWIAMVLAQDTPLVLLDEPVTFLDLRHQWSLLEVLNDLKQSLGKTLITVFHDLNHALAICDRVYVLKTGAVYAHGEPEAVITSAALQGAYGVCAHICRVHEACRSVVVPQCIQGMRPNTAHPSHVLPTN